MPQLSSLLEKRKEKFVKKSYRPWDMGASEDEQRDTSEQTHLEYSIKQADDIQARPSEVASQVSTTHPNHAINTSTVLDNKFSSNLDNKEETYGKQLDNHPITLRKQSDNIAITPSTTIREQLDNEFAADSLKNRLLHLVGIQREILEFVVEFCHLRELTETGPIETFLLAQHVQASYGSIKVSINRLISKGFLIRLKGKTAKGGYINLAVPSEVKRILLGFKQEQQLKQNTPVFLQKLKRESDNKLDNKNPLYSSSYNITTTNENELLSNGWETIDYEPLKSIGFSKSHLKQLINKNTPEAVQESINHFAYGLEHNKKKFEKYADVLNVLMGVLRKGEAWIESHYESPQAQSLRQLVETKKKQKEQEEKLLNELFELEFPDWQKQLSEKEIRDIVPPDIFQSGIRAAITSHLKSYYLNTVLHPRLNKQKLI